MHVISLCIYVWTSTLKQHKLDSLIIGSTLYVLTIILWISSTFQCWDSVTNRTEIFFHCILHFRRKISSENQQNLYYRCLSRAKQLPNEQIHFRPASPRNFWKYNTALILILQLAGKQMLLLVHISMRLIAYELSVALLRFRTDTKRYTSNVKCIVTFDVLKLMTVSMV